MEASVGLTSISVEPGRTGGAARPEDRSSAVDRHGPASAPLVFVLPGYERFTRAVAGAERLAVGRFANGELYAEVPAGVRDRQLRAGGRPSLRRPANLERLTLLAHALRRAGAERVIALLPYLAYARQDRAEPHGEPRAGVGRRAAAREWSRRGRLRGCPQRRWRATCSGCR